jgi:hypothetical protein
MIMDDDLAWPTNNATSSNLDSRDRTLRIAFEQALMTGGGFVKIVELSRDALEVCWNMFQPSKGAPHLHAHAKPS